jgi:signal transduction histidine kinase
MDKVGDNLLQISFIDDGRGIDESIVEDTAFDLGVTTTLGSGLGLYHSKEIMKSLSSEISLLPNNSKGAEVRMVFSR